MDATRTVELVKRAQNGDRDALDRLFARYQEPVLRIVRVRLGAGLRRHLESGDILGRVFVNALQRFSDFEMRDEASFLHWLSQLVVWQIHEQAKHYRSQKVDPRLVVEIDAAPEAYADALEDRADGPSERALVAEDKEIVEECLDQLAPELRELILLRDFVGFTWEQVATRVGLGIGAVRAQHAKAKLELGWALRRRAPDLDGT